MSRARRSPPRPLARIAPPVLDEAPVLADWRGRLIVVTLLFLVVIVFAVIQVAGSAHRAERAVRAVDGDIEAFRTLFEAQAALDELKRAAFALVQTRSEWALTETERAESRFLALVERLPEADEIDRKALAYNAKRVRDLLEDVIARSVFDGASRMSESMHALRVLFEESGEILTTLHAKQERATSARLGAHARALGSAVTRSILLLGLTAAFLIAMAALFEWLSARRRRFLARSVAAIAEGERDLRFGAYDIRSDLGRTLSHLEELQQQLTDLELAVSSSQLEIGDLRKRHADERSGLERELAALREELEKTRLREEALRDLLARHAPAVGRGDAPAQGATDSPGGAVHPLRNQSPRSARA